MEKLGSVLITGCSSGIGASTAEVLREAGWDVIASARKTADVIRLREDGFKAVLIDSTDSTTIEAGFEEAGSLSTSGRIWGVFCNAGYGQPGAIEDVSVDGLRKQLETNVVGTHALIKLACRHMRAKGGGRLLINGSVLGIVGLKYRGAYVASKFAIAGYSDVLRMELKGSGIDVCLIEPGPVYTRFRENGLKAFREHVVLEDSRHADRYVGLEKKLATEGPVAPFTMTSRRCGEIAAKALTCKRPKAKYRVTVQTKVFSVLKRILPTWLMDRVAARG